MKNSLLFLVLILFSCQEYKKTPTNEKLLLGDWIRLRKDQLEKIDTVFFQEDSIYASYLIPEINYTHPPNSFSNLFEPFGLGIYADSLDYFKGFVSITDDTSSNGFTRIYLGNFTHYKINQDTFQLFDKVKDSYQTFLIKKLKPDTLIISSAEYGDTITFRKLNYNLDTLQKFDQLIFSTSFCFGSCPVVNMIIDSDGQILYQGEEYVENLGFYKGKLSKAKTAYIFEKFTKADIRNIPVSFNIGHTDDQTFTTSFIVNKRIYKTVDDYGMAATPEMLWAYIPTFFAYQSADLQKIEEDSLPFYNQIHYFDFTKADSILDVSKSEDFLLWNEMRTAKASNQIFTPIYALSFGYPEQEKATKTRKQITAIKTDGRYYQFMSHKTTLITLDLGYNFIEQNLKTRKMRALEKWEK
jgi:hypothetical protein